MMEGPAFSIEQIAEWCGGRLPPGGTLGRGLIRGIETLANADESQLSWIASSNHQKALAASRAGAVIGRESDLKGHPRGIVVADPEEAIAKALERFQIQLVQPPAV